jgi:hypothetical protein
VTSQLNVQVETQSMRPSDEVTLPYPPTGSRADWLAQVAPQEMPAGLLVTVPVPGLVNCVATGRESWPRKLGLVGMVRRRRRVSAAA